MRHELFYACSAMGNGDLSNPATHLQPSTHSCTDLQSPNQYNEQNTGNGQCNNWVPLTTGDHENLQASPAIDSQGRPPQALHLLDNVMDRHSQEIISSHRLTYITPATSLKSFCGPKSSAELIETRYPVSSTPDTTLRTLHYSPLDQFPPHTASDQGPAVNLQGGPEAEATSDTFPHTEMLPLNNIYSFQEMDDHSGLPSTLLDFNILEERLHHPSYGEQAEALPQPTPSYHQPYTAPAPGQDGSQIRRPSPSLSMVCSSSTFGDSKPAASETPATSIHRQVNFKTRRYGPANLCCSSPQSSPRICTVCGRSYGSSKTLKRHHDETHRPEAPEFCCPASQCKRSPPKAGFPRKHGLVRHMKTCKFLSKSKQEMYPAEVLPSQSAAGLRLRRLNRPRRSRSGRAHGLEAIDEDPIPDEKTGLLEDLVRTFDRGQIIRARLQEMELMGAESAVKAVVDEFGFRGADG